MNKQKQIITSLFKQKSISLEEQKYIAETIKDLDQGLIRVAEKNKYDWQINEWVKKAILLYFKTRKMETIEVGPFEFHDKIPLKKNFKKTLTPGEAVLQWGHERQGTRNCNSPLTEKDERL